MVDEQQLWIVTDDENNWLYYDRGSQQDAIAGAREAGAYTPESTLHLFAVTTEIVIEPEKGDK